MKKYIYIGLLQLIVLFVSCEDMVGLPATRCFGLKLENNKGENLLNPKVPDNIIGKFSPIVETLSQETLTLNWDAPC